MEFRICWNIRHMPLKYSFFRLDFVEVQKMIGTGSTQVENQFYASYCLFVLLDVELNKIEFVFAKWRTQFVCDFGITFPSFGFVPEYWMNS